MALMLLIYQPSHIVTPKQLSKLVKFIHFSVRAQRIAYLSGDVFFRNDDERS